MWTAWATVFIALASLAVSVITASTVIEQGRETREHYRKTVTPLVLPHVTTNPVDETWGIFLDNEGIGPARIDFRTVTLDGKVVTLPDIVTRMSEEGVIGPGTKWALASLEHGSFLRVGGRKMILEVDPKSLDTPAQEAFRGFVRDRIDVRYEWCSLYEGCQEGCTKLGCRVRQRQAPNP